MREVFVVGHQPIPGYEIIESLGGSAFYRMWKVRAPDGSEKIWKEIDLVVGNAAIETRTLGLLIKLRHPNLNTLTNFWQLYEGKTLVTETPVPLMSLQDRFDQYQANGQAIPGEELQEYLLQAAEGLDFLNSPVHEFQGEKVAIYHRSLHPECLLLFSEGAGTICKISDFGLSKPVSEEISQHSQGLVNYDYDPPEFFEGQTTATSDQYALAINYYQLRTGSLPFSGSMLEQLQARLNDTPNLQLLEEPEQSIVLKALSRDPRHRYESSLAFLHQLKKNVVPEAAVASAVSAPPGAFPATPAATAGLGSAEAPGGFAAPSPAPMAPLSPPPSGFDGAAGLGSPGIPATPHGTPTMAGAGAGPSTPMAPPLRSTSSAPPSTLGGVDPGRPAPPQAAPGPVFPPPGPPVGEIPGVVFHRPLPGAPQNAQAAGESADHSQQSAVSGQQSAGSMDPQPKGRQSVAPTDLRTFRQSLSGSATPGTRGGEAEDDGRVPIYWVVLILLATVALVYYLLYL